MAAQQVFAIYELLEPIMLHLPLRQILRIRRTDTRFRDVIKESLKINQALFFSPATDNTIELVNDERRPFRCESSTQTARKHDPKSGTQPVLNPFIAMSEEAGMPYNKWMHDCWPNRYFGFEDEISFDTYKVSQDDPIGSGCEFFSCRIASTEREAMDNMLEGSDGSFRNMLLTHPPCKTITIWSPAVLSGCDCGTSTDIRMEDPELGISFGCFLQEVGTVARLQDDSCTGYECKGIVEVLRGGEIERCPKSVDEMTGWEMLRLFEIGYEAFRGEMQTAGG